MPWSGPCKCPAHILYGTAIGVLKLNVIVLGIGFFQECFNLRIKQTTSFIHVRKKQKDSDNNMISNLYDIRTDNLKANLANKYHE